MKYTFINSLIYLLTYLLTYEYRETFRCGITADWRLLTAVAADMWIFDHTVWNYADQSHDPQFHKLLLTR